MVCNLTSANFTNKPIKPVQILLISLKICNSGIGTLVETVQLSSRSPPCTLNFFTFEACNFIIGFTIIEKKTRKEEVSKTVSIDFFPLTILISRLLTVQSGTQIFQSRGFDRNGILFWKFVLTYCEKPSLEKNNEKFP